MRALVVEPGSKGIALPSIRHDDAPSALLADALHLRQQARVEIWCGHRLTPLSRSRFRLLPLQRRPKSPLFLHAAPHQHRDASQTPLLQWMMAHTLSYTGTPDTQPLERPHHHPKASKIGQWLESGPARPAQYSARAPACGGLPAAGHLESCSRPPPAAPRKSQTLGEG